MVERLGAILGWKFDHVPGITTMDNTLVDWPASLGGRPTDSQIVAWEAEYEISLAAQLALAASTLASATTKLGALGLTDDEIAALRG